MNLEERMLRLERANSRLKATIAVIGLAWIALAGVAAVPDGQPVELIRAKKIEIVDSAGRPRIELRVGPPGMDIGEINFRPTDPSKNATNLSQYGLMLCSGVNGDSRPTLLLHNKLSMQNERGASVEIEIGRKGANRAEVSLTGPKGSGTLAADEQGQSLELNTYETPHLPANPDHTEEKGNVPNADTKEAASNRK